MPRLNGCKSLQCKVQSLDQTDHSVLKENQAEYIRRNIMSSYSILFTPECCCWKEQTANLHQKSYEYQQEMSSRIKTLKRDWHSKRGCKNLYSSSFDIQLRCFYLWASQTCLCIMTQEQKIFTRLLFHPPLIYFTFSNKCLCSCKGDSNTGLGCMALFVVVFASFFHMGRITSATCVRHHIGFMLLWALLWMRWPASETKDSHSHPTTPPLLAFNTPAWLTPADRDWGNASLVSLTSFMHLLLPHSTLCEAEVQWGNGDCWLLIEGCSQFSSVALWRLGAISLSCSTTWSY